MDKLKTLIDALGDNAIPLCILITVLAYGFTLLTPHIVEIIKAFRGCS